jgi:hypothetical protein
MNIFPVFGLEFFLQKVLPIIPSVTKNKEFSFCKLITGSAEGEDSSKERKMTYIEMLFASKEDVRGAACVLHCQVMLLYCLLVSVSCFSPLLILSVLWLFAQHISCQKQVHKLVKTIRLALAEGKVKTKINGWQYSAGPKLIYNFAETKIFRIFLNFAYKFEV